MNAITEERLVQQLVDSQLRLHGFILALLADRDAARDVLQNVNLVLWRKRDSFTPGTDFWAWASQVARFEVRAYYRDRGRERLVFDDETLDTIAETVQQQAFDEDRLRAFHHCLGKLAPRQAEALAARYRGEQSLQQMADESGATLGAMKLLLHRARQALAGCIEKTLGAEAKQQ